MSKEDGGPAFPSPLERYLNEKDEYAYRGGEGMSLRDYFAAAVEIKESDHPDTFVLVEVLLGRPMPAPEADLRGWLEFWAEYEAMVRGIKADAMLAERAKDKP